LVNLLVVNPFKKALFLAIRRWKIRQAFTAESAVAGAANGWIR
jgi:hypothetical protein